MTRFTELIALLILLAALFVALCWLASHGGAK